MSPLPAIPYDPRLLEGAAPRGADQWEVEMVSRRTVIGLGVAGALLAAGGGATAYAYSSAIEGARARVAPALSKVIPSRFGDLEYAEQGEGVPLLMVHGTGGGFDQGLLFARPLTALGYRVIAPSRFGYLRSSFPAEPSSANQADAFVDLLDALGIAKIAIAGLTYHRPQIHRVPIWLVIASAFIIARALFTVSSYSRCGSESATMPAPAWK